MLERSASEARLVKRSHTLHEILLEWTILFQSGGAVVDILGAVSIPGKAS